MNDSATCPECGHTHPAKTKVCPGTKPVTDLLDSSSDPWSAWASTRNKFKTQWVTAVIAFWVSAAVLGLAYSFEKKISLILVSITLGLLILGVWLKTRYQLHLRREPERQSPDVQTD